MRRARDSRGLLAGAIVAMLLLLPAIAEAQDRTVRIAGRRVAIWQPRRADAARGRAPVLIFSHGFGGCATGASFLNAALAARGYWVFAPEHRDGRCAGQPAMRPELPFGQPERWTDTVFDERREDVRAVERALRADRGYAARLDFMRVGYLGHSLGGYTVMGLAGGWPTWVHGAASRPRAVLALSPYVEPFVVRNTLAAVDVPVMFQGGTADAGVTPVITRAGGAYDRVRSPKYLVVFQGARHSAWGDRGGRANHAAIVAYAAAFLDRYVRDAPPAPLLTTPGPRVATLRYDSELGSGRRRAAP